MIQARLVAEGNSDDVLLYPLRWLLASLSPAAVDLRRIDLRGRATPTRTLAERISTARMDHRFDLLFVHRDSDGEDPDERFAEIAAACEGHGTFVAVIPVRCTEAWLLIDEEALRRAADRPNGREHLEFPNTRRLESVAEPKALLRDLLYAAHGQVGRRRARFDPVAARARLAELIDDWSPLRALPAFRRLELDTRAALSARGLPLTNEP